MQRFALAVGLAAALTGPAHAAVTEFVIYKQPHFRGESHVVKGEVAVLEPDFARAGASLVVKGGYWEACSGQRFAGYCRVLGAGEYPTLEPGLDKRIVSIRFIGTETALAQAVGDVLAAERKR